MKKTDISNSSKSRILHSRKDYLREIGERAALLTFKRKGSGNKKLETLTPRITRVLSPDYSTRSMKELRILQDISPRDVSHLRDRVKSPAQKVLDLPNDLDSLKKILNTSTSFQNSSQTGKSPKRDLQEDSLTQSMEKFSIEALAFSFPSGRQGAENLKRWLNTMRANYCLDDLFGQNALLIHGFCSKELVKLVSVTCAEQGQVLKEVLQFYRSLLANMMGKMNGLESAAEENTNKILQAAALKEKCFKEDLAQAQKLIDDCLEKLAKKKSKLVKLRNKVERLEMIVDDLKGKNEGKDENKLRINYIRKGTSVNRSRGIFDTLSPVAIRRQDRLNDLFDFPSTNNSQTQTDKPELVLETLSNYFSTTDEIEKISNLSGTGDINEGDELHNLNIEVLDTSLQSRISNESKLSIKPAEENLNKRKGKRNKTKLTVKKDLTSKQAELDKKLFEKQQLLDKLKRKIKIKAAELDFITKTLHYKKVKEKFMNNQHLGDMTIEKLFHLKPANSKNFNLLADSEFWGEKNRNSSLNKSLTQNLAGVVVERAGRMNTIKEMSINEQAEENSIVDSNIKSIYTDFESFQEPGVDKSFSKKPVGPLEDLTSSIDIFLIQREKSGKKTQALKILEKICEKDINWIKSKALMNRKLMNKLIYSLYLSFYSRHDFSEDFLDYVYYDFFKRYGLKYVSDKKFVEFICSLIKSEDSKKFTMFLRFIGAAQKVSKVNYSKNSFKLFLDGLSFLINSKIGVTFNEDYSDKFLVPTTRACELVKSQLDPIDKQIMLKVSSQIEFKSIPDPKRFNVGGLVDGETALETIIEGYESIKFKYINGVEFLINALKYNEPKDLIIKTEISMFIRIFYPNELEAFEVTFDDCEHISLGMLCSFAVDRKLFELHEVQSFVPDQGQDFDDVDRMFKESIDEMKEIIADFNNLETFMNTLNQQVWQVKLSNLEKGLAARKPYESLFAFKVFLLELLRVQSTFL